MLKTIQTTITNKRLSQGHRSESSVKEKKSQVWIDVQKRSHIQIVGESGRQTDNSNHVLGALNLGGSNQKWKKL